VTEHPAKSVDEITGPVRVQEVAETLVCAPQASRRVAHDRLLECGCSGVALCCERQVGRVGESSDDALGCALYACASGGCGIEEGELTDNAAGLEHRHPEPVVSLDGMYIGGTCQDLEELATFGAGCQQHLIPGKRACLESQRKSIPAVLVHVREERGTQQQFAVVRARGHWVS
jgi:hypothetical protein